MSSENLQQVQNPYSNLTGEQLEAAYTEIVKQKQQIDWNYYYACNELQLRAYKIQKGEQISENMVPPSLRQKAIDAYNSNNTINDANKKVNSDGRIIISENNSPDTSKMSLVVKNVSAQQKEVDKVLKKMLG